MRDTRAFLVMELLHGTTLRDRLRDAKRLPAARTVAILRELAAAVDAAHARQILHRDLKPENVFLVIRPEHEKRTRCQAIRYPG